MGNGLPRFAAVTRFAGVVGLLALFGSDAMTAIYRSQGGTPPAATFKSGVEYVEVDVVVANRQGEVVRDLTKNDFDISEDGKRQAITTFARVDIPIEQFDRLATDTSQPIEADVTTNEHAEGRVYVLLLDDLHTAPLSVQRTKTAANQFIERLGANDLMAVVHTAGGDAGSQGFTNSKRRLLAAVDHTTGHGLASVTAVRNENAVATNGRNTDDTEDPERAANAQTTLRVLRDVANWFATVRGRRKAILLMSEGIDYPMTMEDKPDQPNKPTDVVLATAQEAIESARRSNVSIYGIDPDGLSGASDVTIDYFFGPNNRAMGPRALQREAEMRQDSLRRLSDDTGGIAVVGRNDLEKAYAQIVSDNSTYYVLAYYPATNKRDGKFHKIAVRVDRPGLTTRTRSGYLSPKGNAPTTPALDPTAPSHEMRDALASPVPASGLAMRVSFAPFMGAAPNASVLVTEELRGRDLKLGSPDTLELSYVAVDAAGKVRAGNNDRLQLTALKPDTKAQIEQSGLRMFNRMSLAPGRYAVRIAARDQSGGALGSVSYDLDVPDFQMMPLSMSGLVLTSIATGRMVVAKADSQMKDLLPAPPITERSFPQSDQLWFFAEIYDNAGSTPHKVTIGTTVTAQSGTVAYKTEAEHSSTEFTGPQGVFRHRARVPLNDLAPGAYVLTVETRAHLTHDETASRQVPFTVTAAERR